MAAANYSHDEQGYKGPSRDQFDTVNLDAPVRRAVPGAQPTTDFDSPPVKIGGASRGQFDTVKLDAPVRGGPATPPATNMGEAGAYYYRGQFDTMNMGAPVRPSVPVTGGPPPATNYDTMNMGAPVRQGVPPTLPATNYDTPPAVKGSVAAMGVAVRGEVEAASYRAAPPALSPAHTSTECGGGETPMINVHNKGERMPRGLVIADVSLRCAATASLIVAAGIIASTPTTGTVVDTLDGSVTPYTVTSSAFKYALGADILGVLYSIYEMISAIFRLGTGRLLLGQLSLGIAYIGDLITACLVLTGGTAAASYLKSFNIDAHLCIGFTASCSQWSSGIAISFLAFCCLAANSTISTYCFYKNRT